MTGLQVSAVVEAPGTVGRFNSAWHAPGGPEVLRRAGDAPAIHALITGYQQEGRLLPFARLGFSMVPHAWLPEKIGLDCAGCALFRRCGQSAMRLQLGEHRHLRSEAGRLA